MRGDRSVLLCAVMHGPTNIKFAIFLVYIWVQVMRSEQSEFASGQLH